MNRIARWIEDSPDGEYGDFFVVAGEFGAVSVTADVAAQIEWEGGD